MFKLLKKGQSAVEYTVLFMIVMGALISGGIYFKRGIQGKIRTSVDELGDQYDPTLGDSDVMHRLMSNTTTTILTQNTAGGYWTARQDVTNMIDLKTGYIGAGAY